MRGKSEHSDTLCPFFRVNGDIEPLLPMAQVAAYLGSSVSYVHKLVGAGRLKAISLPVYTKYGREAERRMLRVQLADLQAFMGSCEVVNGDL